MQFGIILCKYQHLILTEAIRLFHPFTNLLTTQQCSSHSLLILLEFELKSTFQGIDYIKEFGMLINLLNVSI